ncbi:MULTISPECIES: V-type ATP synthase subunit D [unclassified Haloferax]|uniref:V-type ATP synthase subunit D n=1 Tax=unclassified Haloferax TaxID=2625095 RepID=UPI0002B02A02|nr:MULTISPECIES: V-type ATP synthase subunit D [unclassified Haloferax]ELZ59516.1 V-type ATP synthase subunit D [Haloferax sp. ATCC BAA-646]ELZ60405.1 V-type ATP synthase subunit D [Haloferax sp. ATCC BAA-645]ELZ72284.1 V-type ATP synthase subunit D [Haloferax sp. ATCC BAA-644]
MPNRRHRRTAPTHRELLSVTDELALARKGERILERRRDSLVFVLLDLLDRWTELRRETDEAFREATDLHVWGAEREGEIALRTLSEARSAHTELIISETKLVGLTVPFFLSTSARRSLDGRGYGVLGTSALDDELVGSYESVVEDVVRLAEMRAVLLRLLAEIRRLRLRVNYLTQRLIPELEVEKRYIRRYLDEREQEERFRQFRTKQRNERRQAERREAERRKAERRKAEQQENEQREAEQREAEQQENERGMETRRTDGGDRD